MYNGNKTRHARARGAGQRGSRGCPQQGGQWAQGRAEPAPSPAGPRREPAGTAWPRRPPVLCFPHPRAQHRQDPLPPQPPSAALASPPNQLLTGPTPGCYSYGGQATASPRGHGTGTAGTRSDPLQTTPLQTQATETKHRLPNCAAGQRHLCPHTDTQPTRDTRSPHVQTHTHVHTEVHTRYSIHQQAKLVKHLNGLELLQSRSGTTC